MKAYIERTAWPATTPSRSRSRLRRAVAPYYRVLDLITHLEPRGTGERTQSALPEEARASARLPAADPGIADAGDIGNIDDVVIEVKNAGSTTSPAGCGRPLSRRRTLEPRLLPW
jgi:hypothetical protein